MTGFKSKRAAALDEDGMYLVHHTKGRVFDKLGNKVNDDDTQVYDDALTIAYQSGYYDGKKAAQRPWVGLTDEEQSLVYDKIKEKPRNKPFWVAFACAIEAKLKENNNAT
jgi:hypothetical protein